MEIRSLLSSVVGTKCMSCFILPRKVKVFSDISSSHYDGNVQDIVDKLKLIVQPKSSIQICFIEYF